MEDILKETWQQIAAAVAALFGSGAAGGVVGKKLIDKEQNARIKTLEDAMKTIKPLIYENANAIALVKKDVDGNTERDREFRQEIKGLVGRVEDKLDRIGDYLLNQKK